MDLSDLFKFVGKFSKKDRVFTLSFKIPDAVAVWSCFDEKTVSNVTEKLDKALLKDLDSIFQSARFMFLMHLPDDEDDYDLMIEVEEEIHTYKKGRKPPKSLGTWKYSRNDRLAVLVWNVPDWFQDIKDYQGSKGRFYFPNFEEIHNTCKDWFIDSP